MAFPSAEQEVILQHLVERKTSALVVSGPGTGKSRTALELARRTIAQLPPETGRQILLLSFSNSTIQRLARSAGVHFAKRERRHLRFMTFHACAAELLAQYGRFAGLPMRTRILDKLDEHLVAFESGWDERQPDHASRLHELAKTQGLLVFDVLIPLALSLLRSSPTLHDIIGRSYPLIIVDEFQDTSESQWRFVQALGDHSQVVAFADPNQIIYASMHGATQERLSEFERWKAVTRTELPPHSHRCSTARILTFAGCLLRGEPYTGDFGDGLQTLPLRYRDQLRAHLALIWREIQRLIRLDQSISVLVPNNRIAEDITVALRNPPAESGISFPVYARVARDDAAYDAVRLSLAALRDLALASTDHNRARAAVVLCAMNALWNRRRKPRPSDASRVASALADAAADGGSGLRALAESLSGAGAPVLGLDDLLPVIADWPEFNVACRRIEAHFELRKETVSVGPRESSLLDEYRAARTPKGLYGDEVLEGRTHVLTYHRAKGREFDFVVLVVEPRGESSEPTLDEVRRLYYVCATRAKRWLGIVYFQNALGRVLGPALQPVGR